MEQLTPYQWIGLWSFTLTLFTWLDMYPQTKQPSWHGMPVVQTIVACDTIGQSDVDPKGVVIHSQPLNTVELLSTWGQGVTCRQKLRERHRALLFLSMLLSVLLLVTPSLLTITFNVPKEKSERVWAVRGVKDSDKVKKKTSYVRQSKGMCVMYGHITYSK